MAPCLPQEDDPLDFGSGVTGRFTVWAPDRELNPGLADQPDVDPYGLIITHPLPGGDVCCGGITFDGEVARLHSPDGPRWVVEQLEPLTLSPSILCDCGFHGFIRDGRWVPA